MNIQAIYGLFGQKKDNTEEEEEKEKEKEKHKRNEEQHKSVMDKIRRLKKSSTRTLSNNEIWTILDDIWNSIEYSVTLDKTNKLIDDELLLFWSLRKDYDLRVEIYMRQISDSRGYDLYKKLRNL